MKKLVLIWCLALIVSTGVAQTSSYLLDNNNVSARVSDNGIFFNDESLGLPGYEVPAGSGNHLIYAMGFWFGGEDINGQIKLAAQTYTGNADFFSGALVNDGTATAPVPAENAAIYPVLKSEIDYHIAHFGDVGYVIPSSILNWPAHGDVSVGVDYFLAPFVDVNSDQVYNPADGDYPKIKGDEAVYMIMNDKADVHGSGGAPIGLEIHFLFYQYNTTDYLNDITFLNMKVINRGTQTIFNFKAGCFVDPDIGGSTDDFAGYNADGNVMFAYNADNSDADYGMDPPALGITLLSQDASSFNVFDGSGATGLPTTPVGYSNYLNGMWNDGTSFTEGGNGYGGMVSTNFLYDGNPNNSGEWSEFTEGHPGGDRTMLLSSQKDVLVPFEIICYDYAFLYNRDGNNLQNVQGIIDDAIALNTWYQTAGDFYCQEGTVTLGIKEAAEEMTVYPNPVQTGFYVKLDGVFDLEIFTIDGRFVHAESKVSGQTYIEPNLENGIYLLVVKQGEKIYQSRILIE